jgi:hypothetical protein
MKNGVFWDVTPCDSCKNRRFDTDSCHPGDGGAKFLRNVCSHKSHTAQHPRRRHSSSSYCFPFSPIISTASFTAFNTAHKKKTGKTRNHWVCELCPLYGILNSYKTRCFGKWICFRLEVRKGRETYKVRYLKKS